MSNTETKEAKDVKDVYTIVKNGEKAFWQKIGRAHGEVFGEIRPATTMVEVKRLISPTMLVEIEAEALVE